MFRKNLKKYSVQVPERVFTLKNKCQEKAVGTILWIKIYKVLALIKGLFEINFKSKRFEYKPIA